MNHGDGSQTEERGAGELNARFGESELDWGSRFNECIDKN